MSNKMFEKFLQVVNQYSPLSNGEIEYIKDNVPIKTFKKNEIILSEGKLARTIYFLLQGCVRMYYNADGVDKTAFFYTEGKFICASESYTYDVPTMQNYQAIEDNTILMFFHKQTIENLIQLYPNFSLIALYATENELITSQKILASFITKSPEERFNDLLQTNGALFQRVPQQYIASYLGVSPETLSRIKKRSVSKRKFD